MFGCLDVELPKGLFCQLQRREVKVVRLLKQTLFRLLVVAVDGDLLQDESWRADGGRVRPGAEIRQWKGNVPLTLLEEASSRWSSGRM